MQQVVQITKVLCKCLFYSPTEISEMHCVLPTKIALVFFLEDYFYVSLMGNLYTAYKCTHLIFTHCSVSCKSWEIITQGMV